MTNMTYYGHHLYQGIGYISKVDKRVHFLQYVGMSEIYCVLKSLLQFCLEF